MFIIPPATSCGVAEILDTTTRFKNGNNLHRFRMTKLHKGLRATEIHSVRSRLLPAEVDLPSLSVIK